VFSSSKDRIASWLNVASVSGWDGSLREKMARELQSAIDQQVKPHLIRKVRSGRFSVSDVEDLCQSTAAGFILAAESGRIQPDLHSGKYDAQIVGRYLHGIAVHKLSDLRRELGQPQAPYQQAVQKIATQLNDILQSPTARDQLQRGIRSEELARLLELLDDYLRQAAPSSVGPGRGQPDPAVARMKSALVERLEQHKLKPGKGDFGLLGPEAVRGLLAELASEAGLKLEGGRRPQSAYRQRWVGLAGSPDGMLSEIVETREHEAEADERLWQQLREASRECSAQDVIVAYLSFAGASHKSIARHCGVHINTVTNCIRRVVEQLRYILHASGQGVN